LEGNGINMKGYKRLYRKRKTFSFPLSYTLTTDEVFQNFKKAE